MEFLRQLDIITPKDIAWPVHLIGCGGIGSALILPLFKLGVTELHLWDDDFVEPHNLPNQEIYRPSDIGKPKVQAAADFLAMYGDEIAVTQHPVRFPGDGAEQLEGIVISGVDSMASRFAIWERVQYNPDIVLYLDGRLGSENLHLITVRPALFDDVEYYEKYLFPDSSAAKLPCTAASIIHSAVTLSGLVTCNITRWVRGESFAQSMRYEMAGPRFIIGRRSDDDISEKEN